MHSTLVRQATATRALLSVLTTKIEESSLNSEVLLTIHILQLYFCIRLGKYDIVVFNTIFYKSRVVRNGHRSNIFQCWIGRDGCRFLLQYIWLQNQPKISCVHLVRAGT